MNKITANQPASVGIVKKNAEKMYQEELDNPDRPASKFKKDALVLRGKLQRAREVLEKTQAPKEILVEVSNQPVVTSEDAPAEQVVNGEVLVSSSQVNQLRNALFHVRCSSSQRLHLRWSVFLHFSQTKMHLQVLPRFHRLFTAHHVS